MQNTAKINDQVIAYHVEPSGKSYRSDLVSMIQYDENELKKYLQYGKQDCAASDLYNSTKQHQFKAK